MASCAREKETVLSFPQAGVAKLVYAPDSKSGEVKLMSVRVRPPAPNSFECLGKSGHSYQSSPDRVQEFHCQRSLPAHRWLYPSSRLRRVHNAESTSYLCGLRWIQSLQGRVRLVASE